MKSYEETAQSILSRRDEYNKRKKKIITVLVSALCVCLAAAIAIPAVLKSAKTADESLSVPHSDNKNAYEAGGGNNKPVRGGNTDEIVEEDPAAEAAQEKEAEFETDSDEKPSVEIENEPRDEPRDPIKEGIVPDAGSSAFMMPDNMPTAEDYETTPMISSYGTGEAWRYSSVQNGEVIFSTGLSEAMANYGDAVRYRVAFDLFCDGVLLDPAGGEAEKVLGSLASRGIITAYENGVSENGAFAYLTLHATYENLASFIPNSAFGYALYLYGEYTGCTEETVEVSNGFCN